MGRRAVFALLCGALLGVRAVPAAEGRSSRPVAGLRVHVLRDQFVPNDMGPTRHRWTPQPNRIVHLAVGEAWEDSLVTDARGNAWFRRVPPGRAKLWCDPHPFAGNPETLVGGGDVTLRSRTVATDTLWLQCMVMGLFR